jgi:hypothetical protein
MDQYLKDPQRATTRLSPKSAFKNVESPCFIELSITHQGSNQARSVEVRSKGREAVFRCGGENKTISGESGH